jgi:TetR/AcrR family transcriptional repressor of nem operon
MRDMSRQRAETRQRIVQAAGALFRQHGIDGVGVDAIMREAGMTHGGFYLYFASKEALVAAVSAEQLARSAARWTEIGDSLSPSEALEKIIGAYLDPRHLEPKDVSCVLPALGAELARRPDSRGAVTEAMRSMIGVLAKLLPARGRARRESAAMAALSTLVGAVVLARLSSDRELADAILASAREQTMPRLKPVHSVGGELC